MIKDIYLDIVDIVMSYSDLVQHKEVKNNNVGFVEDYTCIYKNDYNIFIQGYLNSNNKKDIIDTIVSIDMYLKGTEYEIKNVVILHLGSVFSYGPYFRKSLKNAENDILSFYSNKTKYDEKISIKISKK